MRKKLFAVIMSAMMMITLMPAMAFASVGTGVTSWTKDFNTIKWTGHSAATFKDAQATDLGTPAVDGFSGLMKASAKTDSSKFVEYYDLDNASIATIGGKDYDSSVNEYTYADLFGPSGFFNGVATNATTTSAVELSFAKPACDGEYDNTAGRDKIDRYHTSATLGASDINTLTDINGTAINATIEVEVPDYDEAKKFEAQTFTLNAWVKATIDPSTGEPYNEDTMDYFKGSLKPITIKVKAQEADFDMLNYQLDGKDITAPLYYDGAEHTLTQETLPNITSTFELLNTKTHAYEAVSSDGVKMKNAGTYQLRITAKNSKTGETETWNTSYVINTADDVYVTFKGTPDATTGDFAFTVAGKYDAKDYLLVAHKAVKTDAWFAQTKKAVKADQKEIAAYANEMYDLVVEDDVASFEKKILTAAEEKAIEKKYADLLGNYDNVCLEADEAVTATFKVIDDISFTNNTPLAKTYKAKNGKLPKNKTFKVKAKAASGAELVYKVTGGAGKIVVNRATGKVTCKKGLKKGTHKVKVYAITLKSFNGGNDNWVEDHYTLKIKVK